MLVTVTNIMNSAGIPGPLHDDDEQPDVRELARRVTVLETRFDTVLPTLATKADLAELRTELLVKLEAMRAEFRISQEALRADLIKWMAATLITMLLSFVGLFVGLARTLAVAPVAPHAAIALPVDLPRLGVIAQPNLPMIAHHPVRRDLRSRSITFRHSRQNYP